MRDAREIPRRNVTSQCGEDGVLSDIFHALGISHGVCVDVGAWDGKVNSNTYNLIVNCGWRGVMIEADASRFDALRQTYATRNDVLKLHRMVGLASPDTLDEILAATSLPHDFEFLNLDIDGNDYHVFAAMQKFQPKVVLIEFNPSIPNDFRFVQAADLRCQQGSSLLALVELAKKKGYELAATTLCNAIFVRRELMPAGVDNSLAVMHPNTDLQTHIIQLHDGTLMLAGYADFIWRDPQQPLDLSRVVTKREEMQFKPFKAERKKS